MLHRFLVYYSFFSHFCLGLFNIKQTQVLRGGIIIHTLFRDFLRFRQESEKISDKSSVLSFKMYTLEEIYEWIAIERDLLNSYLSRLYFSLGSISRSVEHERDYLAGWEATVITHALQNPDEVEEHFAKFDKCYGDAFKVFILKAIVEYRKESRADSQELSFIP